jgi:hypothetical protein
MLNWYQFQKTAANILETVQQLETQAWMNWDDLRTTGHLSFLMQYLQTGKTDPNYQRTIAILNKTIPQMKNVSRSPRLRQQVQMLENILLETGNQAGKVEGDTASRRSGQL